MHHALMYGSNAVCNDVHFAIWHVYLQGVFRHEGMMLHIMLAASTSPFESFPVIEGSWCVQDPVGSRTCGCERACRSVCRTLCASVQAVIEGYLRPMLADNWDKGSLYSYRAFSFPSDMPYEAITQPVLFITGEKDQPLTRGAQKVYPKSPCVLL